MLNAVADREIHLQMIQATITRLAGQSTTIKGWAVTLTAALLGLGATTNTALVAFAAVYAIATLAALDAYYLTLERRYRDLYRASADVTQPVTWTMTITPPRIPDLVRATASPSIAPLYGASTLVAIALGIYLTHK